ncbi:GNAT family N-acetyltransferase [Niveibacterium umoris]|uniref:GNAT family N-acetyltransferase n=1 Tax=Niveibacterium umoris TaxID=1193620 RepID=UPI0016136DD1|nr:GNAT family N-acetyltransferase [Niveibacterium umoris]
MRRAGAPDTAAIARLHADSWRAAYRGLLDDAYLDETVFAERAALWHARLVEGRDAPLEAWVLEDARGLRGFASLCPLADPAWGPLIDNLHVRPTLRGEGLGRQMMAALQQRIGDLGAPRYHLWVLEGNVAARRFYARVGGIEQTREIHDMPDGGRYPCLRVVWAQDASPGP